MFADGKADDIEQNYTFHNFYFVANSLVFMTLDVLLSLSSCRISMLTKRIYQTLSIKRLREPKHQQFFLSKNKKAPDVLK